MARSDKAKIEVSRRQSPKALRRVVLTSVLASLSILQSCASIPGTPGDAPPVETTIFSAPQEDLDSVVYNPTFEPDYNNLTPQPWVEPVTTAQQDAADVYPDRLEFPAAMTEVLAWEAGRLVVGAPSQGAGKNAMGFARRVASVAMMGDKIVVMTRSVAIEDILQGDVQLRLDPEAAQPLDLSKADLDWVANNLYFQETDPVAMPGELLTDDAPGDAVALGLFGKIKNAVSTAAKAVAAAAKDVYLAVTPATISGSVKPVKKITLKDEHSLFEKSAFSKSFKTKGGLPAEFSLGGSGKYTAGVEFDPGLQIGAKLALPGHNANSQFWLNVDSSFKAQLEMELELAATLASADNKKGATLEDLLGRASPFTEDVLNSYRNQLFGVSDSKPAGNWKKTLYVSQPLIYDVQVGLVPVIFTVTLQVDLECGFEAKANITSKLNLEQNATFKFKVLHDRGTKQTKIEGPTFAAPRRFDVSVTGEGALTLSCGLIPRVNAFVYDSIGIFAGVRASLVGKAGYASECEMKTRSHIPTGKVTLGLYANVGVQAGARVQAPGASALGSVGRVAGLEYAQELWTKEFKLLEKEWEFAKGFGYCSSICSSDQCGGSCRSCLLGEECARNSDCANSVCNKGDCSKKACGDEVPGKCSTNRCGDAVTDAQESDVDCGGPVELCAARCAVDKECEAGSDCETGFCGARGSAMPGVCVANHCSDGALDGDEGGIDCGGATCAKCASGVQVRSASDCASGMWNGVACVGAVCDDNIKSGDETDSDCGGTTCARRCGFLQGCASNADCAASAPVCDPARKVCIRTAGVPLRALWVGDNNNAWAVGNNGTVLKWNGTAWTNQTSGISSNLRGVFGLGLNDVWTVGWEGAIFRGSGSVWSPQMSDITAESLYGVWGTSANNVWVAGNLGMIRFWNGVVWTDQPSGVTAQIRDLWGVSINNIWAVGEGGTILKWNGSTWTPQSSGTTQSLWRVWGTGINNIWAVGDGGTILKWNGSAWGVQNSATTQGLVGIWGTNDNNIWAVGDSGTILKWNGVSWMAQNSGTTQNLADVGGANINSAWAVGDSGTIV